MKQTKRDRAGLGQSIQGATPWKVALAAGNKPFSRKWHSGHFQVDKNHNGVMDNRDLTSVSSPDMFWVNNDVDRWHTVDGTDSEQDDLQINDSSLAGWQQVPDCQYQNGIGQYAIPSTRDLEDYARLWIPGLTNLMQVLPSGYGINLQWRNNSGAGIRLFGAADSDGGTNYLFRWHHCYEPNRYGLVSLFWLRHFQSTACR